jgi:hypothetical protein
LTSLTTIDEAIRNARTPKLTLGGRIQIASSEVYFAKPL